MVPRTYIQARSKEAAQPVVLDACAGGGLAAVTVGAAWHSTALNELTQDLLSRNGVHNSARARKPIIQLCEATSTPCSFGHNSSFHRLQHHHLQDRHDGAHDCHALARPAARGPGGVDAHHSPIYLVGSQKDDLLHSALAHFSARRVRIRAHSSLSLQILPRRARATS